MIEQNKLLLDSTSEKNDMALVSVIVPAYNAEDFLEKNVKSYLKQTLANIEIIIVNDGSKDKTEKIARRLVKLDNRVRLVSKPNGGLSSARNAGVDVATGKYIFFIDPDDYMDDDTLEVLYASLEESGSDVAITGYDLAYPKSIRKPGAWMQRLFMESKQHFVVDEYPEIIQASTAWGKLIRASFYKQANLTFIDGILYEDQPFTAKMYANAHNGIDLIGEYKIHWVQRDASISHQVTVKDLNARFNSAELALAALSEFSNENVYQARLTQNLNNDFRYIMRKYNKVDSEYNDILFAKLPVFYNQLEDKSQLDGVIDVAYRLIAQNDREKFSQYLTVTDLSNYHLKVINDGNKPVIDWSTLAFIDDFQTEGRILEETFRPYALVTGVKTVHSGLDLSLQAYISKLDCHEFAYDVRLNLIEIDEATGLEIRKIAQLEPSRQFSAPETIREHKEWWADYSDNFYTFTIPTDMIALNTSVKLQVEMTAGNRHVYHDVEGVRNDGTGSWLLNAVSPETLMSLKYVGAKSRKSYYLKHEPRVTYTVQEVKGQHVTFLVQSGTELDHAEMVSIPRKAVKIPVALTPTENEREYLATVNFSKLRHSNGYLDDIKTRHRFKKKDWKFQFYTANEDLVPSLQNTTDAVVVPNSNILMTNHATHGAKFIIAPVINVKHAKISSEHLELDVTLQNGPTQGLDTIVCVTAGKVKKQVRMHLDSGQSTKILVPFTQESFGQRLPIPTGLYRVTFETVYNRVHQYIHGREHKVVYDESLIKSLPINEYVDGIQEHRLDFDYRNQRLRFQLFNHMPDNNKGGYGWSRMMSRYWNSTEPTDPRIVLFRTYYGESVTDNAVALTHEILNDPTLDLDIYWAVKDPSIKVPEGTRAVVVNSEEWFELLAKAGTVVENVHQMNYMVKKPGQRIVQAFHGYPYKDMGNTFYQSHDYNLARIESFENREADWDYILSPAPYASALYQEHFNFKGEMLEVGHPRNDILVDDSRENERVEINQQVRERLNIGQDKKIVLYAPTYRDYASETEFKSNRVDFVSYDKLAKKLGDDYVILVRGHMMNRRAGNTVSTSNVIDVTSYPEILDLIIASDLAVLDYSSLRFDYAQTGKPMIFLVPDLDLYEETRGGLMPYLPTAPGWIVNNESELIDAIKHSDEYMTIYGDAWRTFRQDYTPLDAGHAAKRMVAKLFK